MQDYKKMSGGRATHLVEKVNYGAELICRIRRNVDVCYEDKDFVEESIYLAAKSHFNLAMLTLWHNFPPPPSELDNLQCTILSSLNAGHVKHGNFQQCFGWVKEVMAFNNPQKWRPVEIVLYEIPAQMEALLQSEKIVDIQLHMEKNKDNFEWIQKQSRIISKYQHIDRVPPLERMLCQFIDLLKPFSKHMDDVNAKLYTKTQDESLKDIQLVSEFLVAVKDWLMQRRREIQLMCSLVKDTQLPMFDLAEIETRQCTSTEKMARVFILKMDYKQDTLMEYIQKIVGHQEPRFKLPAFSIVSSDKKRLEQIAGRLNTFDKLNTMLLREQSPIIYNIGLVPISSSQRDGDQINVEFLTNEPKEMTPSQVEPAKANRQHQTSSPLNARLFPPPLVKLAPTAFNHYQQMTSEIKTPGTSAPDTFAQTNAIKLDKVNPYFQLQKEMAMPSPRSTTKVETPPPQPVKSMMVDELEHDFGTISFGDLQDLDSILKENSSSKTTDTTNVSSLVKPDPEIGESLDRYIDDSTKRPCPDESASGNSIEDRKQDIRSSVVDKTRANEQRAGEYFAQESNGCSQLVKQGKPNVYLLNAEQIWAGSDVRRFEIGQSTSSYPRREHKYIILMGATGCGKSTLINGMVNYILGVQWNDPFRFKCVREDESASRNQAHSQTSSVTAYTIHHRNGMAVPYSITIIDTPGYGDTSGIARDKEITKTIHRFLSQEKTRIEQIHAACFVAASGDSRLTATQRYILDSVLSIFGKDVQENIRLLVTFADNATPPVVEACAAANFPVTSVSAGIVYSKFNSSVLFASNDKEESFDELFWDMGQENFFKFFSMLEGMKGKDLASTRKVIESRDLLEQSLLDIEIELDECLDNIEGIEKFRSQIRECDYKMESTKNFTTEKMATRLIKMDCPKGYYAYNCLKCHQKTCEKLFREKFEKRRCDDLKCNCPPADHYFQEFHWGLVTAKETKTLKKMKKEYEANCNDKKGVEELLEKCSYELDMATTKVLSLLEQVGATASSLNSTALRYNAISPADYLSLMRSKVTEEQKSGYLTRLDTLNRLQLKLTMEKRTATATKENKTGGQIGGRGLQEDNKTDVKPCGRGRGHLLLQQFQQGKSSDGYAGKSTETKSGSSQPIEMSGVKSKLPADDHFCGATSSVSQLPSQTSAGGRDRGRGTSQPNASPVVGHPSGSPEDYYGSAVKDKSSNKSPPTENLQKGKDGEHYSSDEETEKREEKKAPGTLEKMYNAVSSIFK